MSTITVASVTLANFRFRVSAGASVYLRLYVDRPFLTSDGTPVEPGTVDGPDWYKQITCSLVGTDLTIPSFTIDSTTDALDTPGQAARYSAWFYAGSRQLGPYAGFESFRIIPTYATSPTTWSLIRQDNANVVVGSPTYLDTYDRATINRLIADAVSMSAGITMLGGLTGPHIAFVNDTNVTITGAGSDLTLGWQGTLAVDRGGLGRGSLTANGVVYGNGAGAVGVTSQGPANSILTANAGAPVFSQSPTVETSLTIGAAGATTGSLILANSSNAFTTTLRPGTPSGALTFTLPAADGATGGLLKTDGSGTLAFTSAPSVTSIALSSLTAGRIVFAGASGLLSDAATFLRNSSTGNVSIGTTNADERITIPQGAYLGGLNNAGAAAVKLIGSVYNATDLVDAVAIGTGASRIALNAFVYSSLANPTVTSDITTAGSWGKLFYDGAVTPVAQAFGLRATFDATYASPGNVDVLNVIGVTLGTRNATAIKGTMTASANGSNAFGANLIAVAAGTGADVVNAIGLEINPVVLTSGTGNHAQGVYVATVGNGSTVAGSFGAYYKAGVSVGPAAAGAKYGLEFDSSIAPAILAHATATGSAIIRVNGAITPTYGLDLADCNAAAAGVLLHNANAIVSNTTGLSPAEICALSASNYVTLGHGTYSASGAVGTILYDGGGEAMRAVRSGSLGVVGNVGWNQGSPAAQHHVTAIAKRALSGTNYNASTVSTTITATGSLFLSELAPGSSLVLSTEPSTVYIVTAIASDTSLTINTNPAVNTATATAKSDYRTLVVEGASGEAWLELDAQHTLALYGNSTFTDGRGMLALHARSATAKQLLFGVDATSSYSYISSINEGTGWIPLILQGGAGSGGTGGVVIGTSTPSTYGAMLKVESGQTNPGGNKVSLEANDISTNNSGVELQKISLQLLNGGVWQGRNIGIYSSPTGGTEIATGNRFDFPVYAVGGKSYFGPASGIHISSPVPPTAPRATIEIYGFSTESITSGADTAQTIAGTTVSGTGTQWNTVGNSQRLRAGDAVMFGADDVSYQVASVTSDTSFELTTSYGGTPASGIEAYRDPYLLLISNAFGTERFRIESSGLTILGGKLRWKAAASIVSAATIDVSVAQGNKIHITGATGPIATINGGEDGDEIFLVFDSTPTVNETGNIALGGAFVATANSSLTLVYDTTASKWIERARSIN